MIWHDISDPKARELDQLAERYRLHPVYVKDCRGSGQRAKVEATEQYLFIVLKIGSAQEFVKVRNWRVFQNPGLRPLSLHFDGHRTETF